MSKKTRSHSQQHAQQFTLQQISEFEKLACDSLPELRTTPSPARNAKKITTFLERKRCSTSLARISAKQYRTTNNARRLLANLCNTTCNANCPTKLSAQRIRVRGSRRRIYHAGTNPAAAKNARTAAVRSVVQDDARLRKYVTQFAPAVRGLRDGLFLEDLGEAGACLRKYVLGFQPTQQRAAQSCNPCYISHGACHVPRHLEEH